MIVCLEIEQKQAQDRKTHFETVSLPVAQVLSPVARQAPTKRGILGVTVSQNSFVLVFTGYRAILTRFGAKWGIAEMCLCETKYQGGVIAPSSWGSANLPDNLSRDMGYRSDSIAISRDMGPLRSLPVAKILSPVTREAPTNPLIKVVNPHLLN